MCSIITSRRVVFKMGLVGIFFKRKLRACEHDKIFINTRFLQEEEKELVGSAPLALSTNNVSMKTLIWTS